MFDFSRSRKRAVIGAVFLVLVLGLGMLTYFVFIKPPETCFDGKQNQDEEGVDCGGACALVCEELIQAEAIQITETALVPAGRSGQFDILGKVKNPNPDAGAVSFRYEFQIKDSSGAVVASRAGNSFILPGEEKYLMAINVEASNGQAATLEISDAKWQRLSNYRGKPPLSIYQKRYNELYGAAAFGEAYGLVANESAFDFRTLTVRVVLRDASGTPLAINMTEMRTVRSKEERDFRLLWPSAFPGTVARVEMEAEADVYNSENFIREYLPGGRFQEFAPGAAF